MRYVEDTLHSGKTLLIILLLILICLGVCGGIWLVYHYPNCRYLYCDYATHGFMESYSKKTLLRVFFNSVSWTGYLLIFVYLCGYSAITQLLELLTLLFRGFAIGISAIATYMQYQSKGILIFLLMMLFNIVSSTIVLVYGVVHSMEQSTNIAYTILGKRYNPIDIKQYSIKFLMLFGILIAIGLIDTTITYLLTNAMLK